MKDVLLIGPLFHCRPLFLMRPSFVMDSHVVPAVVVDAYRTKSVSHVLNMFVIVVDCINPQPFVQPYN